MTEHRVWIGQSIHIHESESFATGDPLVVTIYCGNGNRDGFRLEFDDRKAAAEIAAALTRFVEASPKAREVAEDLR